MYIVNTSIVLSNPIGTCSLCMIYNLHVNFKDSKQSIALLLSHWLKNVGSDNIAKVPIVIFLLLSYGTQIYPVFPVLTLKNHTSYLYLLCSIYFHLAWFQVVTKPEYKFLEDPLYEGISILIWDPANYSSTLEDWYQHPDFPLFPVYKKLVTLKFVL